MVQQQLGSLPFATFLVSRLARIYYYNSLQCRAFSFLFVFPFSPFFPSVSAPGSSTPAVFSEGGIRRCVRRMGSWYHDTGEGTESGASGVLFDYVTQKSSSIWLIGGRGTRVRFKPLPNGTAS